LYAFFPTSLFQSPYRTEEIGVLFRAKFITPNTLFSSLFGRDFLCQHRALPRPFFPSAWPSPHPVTDHKCASHFIRPRNFLLECFYPTRTCPTRLFPCSQCRPSFYIPSSHFSLLVGVLNVRASCTTSCPAGLFPFPLFFSFPETRLRCFYVNDRRWPTAEENHECIASVFFSGSVPTSVIDVASVFPSFSQPEKEVGTCKYKTVGV